MFDSKLDSPQNFTNIGHKTILKRILECLKRKKGYEYIEITEFKFLSVGTLEKRKAYLKECGLNLETQV